MDEKLEVLLSKGDIIPANPDKLEVKNTLKNSLYYLKKAESALSAGDFQSAGLSAINSLKFSAESLLMNSGYRISGGSYKPNEAMLLILKLFYLNKNKINRKTFIAFENYLADDSVKSYSTDEAGISTIYSAENKAYVIGLVEFAKEFLGKVKELLSG